MQEIRTRPARNRVESSSGELRRRSDQRQSGKIALATSAKHTGHFTINKALARVLIETVIGFGPGLNGVFGGTWSKSMARNRGTVTVRHVRMTQESGPDVFLLVA